MLAVIVALHPSRIDTIISMASIQRDGVGDETYAVRDRARSFSCAHLRKYLGNDSTRSVNGGVQLRRDGLFFWVGRHTIFVSWTRVLSETAITSMRSTS